MVAAIWKARKAETKSRSADRTHDRLAFMTFPLGLLEFARAEL
jgi:hypothetical protein